MRRTSNALMHTVGACAIPKLSAAQPLAHNGQVRYGTAEPTIHPPRLVTTKVYLHQSSTPPTSKCAKCGKGRMPNPIVCVQCNGAFHQALICSGLRNRYAVEAARPSWKCEQCKHPTRTVAPDPSQSSSSLPKPRCHKVAEGFLTCNSCGVATHQVKKCSGLDTRGAIESVKKNKD